MKKTLSAVIAALGVALSVFAQGDPQPTCHMCPASFVGNDEIQAYVKKAVAEKLTDQQIRDVEIGKSHVGIGVVHRGKLEAPAPASVNPTWVSLADNITRLNLAVDQILPLHGRVVSLGDLNKLIGR